MNYPMTPLAATIVVALLLFLLAFGPVTAQVSSDRISIHELKQKMDRREKILVLDARSGNALLGSRVRIRGARHFTSADLEKGVAHLPRDREIITYCT